MEKQEKKIWEKPLVQILPVKEITLGGPSDHVGEETEPAYKLGWS